MLEEVALDALDRKILYELDMDARQSMAQLSRKVKRSKQVVSYRMKRLEEQRIITAYATLIDTSKLGYTTFRCYLKLKGVTERQRKRTRTFLNEHPSIWAIVALAGKWDFALGISVKDIASFHKAWDAILRELLPSLADFAVHIYEPTYHYTKTYLVSHAQEPQTVVLGAENEVSHDETDLQILRILARNARESLISISNAVHLSVEGARQRISQLQRRGIIKGYRIHIDVARLGYDFFKAEVRFAKYDHFPAVLEFCRQNPFIYQVDKVIGGETLDIEFQVRDVRQMLSIIEDMEEQIPGLIERFDYLTVLEQVKEEYMA